MEITKIAVIGLGYVGLPVAVNLSKKFNVVGFDINQQRLQQLRSGIDHTGEIDSQGLINCNISYSSDFYDLKESNFYIITVPTPVDEFNKPDFTYLLQASKTVGKVLKMGDIVVYESTVYPGATQEICLPVLEMESKLSNQNGDFFIGYSPERINPADREHTFTKISKIVSGCCNDSLEAIAKVYGSVIKAPIFKASSIRVAEAAKVIENIQRDVNIALINELAMLFDHLKIDTLDVLQAASTKWNFLNFKPGLVGGHCIGVDPYYLTHKAESVGYHPQVILSGRRINNNIPNFIVYKTLQNMVSAGINIENATVSVLGLSFKENCPDIRNSKVFDIIDELRKFKIKTQLCDPVVGAVNSSYPDIKLLEIGEIEKSDVIILAVAHDILKENIANIINEKLHKGGLVIDVKGIVDRHFVESLGHNYWRL